MAAYVGSWFLALQIGIDWVPEVQIYEANLKSKIQPS